MAEEAFQAFVREQRAQRPLGAEDPDWEDEWDDLTLAQKARYVEKAAVAAQAFVPQQTKPVASSPRSAPTASSPRPVTVASTSKATSFSSGAGPSGSKPASLEPPPKRPKKARVAPRRPTCPMDASPADIAAREGLALVPGSGASGYRGVSAQGSHSKTFKAVWWDQNGTTTHLGSYPTPGDAALRVARYLGPASIELAAAASAALEAAVGLCEEEVRQRAQAEGLVLLPKASNASGWMGVQVLRSAHRPYCAATMVDGKQKTLGSFRTAIEAALCYARHLGPEATRDMEATLRKREEEAPAKEAKLKEEQQQREEKERERQQAKKAAKLAQQQEQEKRRREEEQVKRRQAEKAMMNQFIRECRATAKAAEKAAKLAQVQEEKRRQQEKIELARVKREKGAIAEAVRMASRAAREARAAEIAAAEKKRAAAISEWRAQTDAKRAAQRELGAAERRAREEEHMSIDEAERIAQAEGLQLIRSETKASGFEGVTWRNRPSKPYRVAITRRRITRGHATRYEICGVGGYGSVGEAALAYARALGPEGVAAAVAAAKEAAATAATAAAQKAAEAQAASHAARAERAVERSSTSLRASVLPERFGAQSTERDMGKRYKADRPNAPLEPKLQPGAACVDKQGRSWWVVEQLLAERRTPAGREFLVRWQDYGAEADSWEPEKNVKDEWQIRVFDAPRKRARSQPTVFPQSSPSSQRPMGAWQARANCTEHAQRIGPEHQAAIPDVCLDDDSSLDGADVPEVVPHAAMLREAAMDTAALLTAAAFAPVGPFCFVATCDCGLGLFARSALQPGQFIEEYAATPKSICIAAPFLSCPPLHRRYSGPRLPLRLHTGGRYVLEVPGTSTIVDGNSENSPFDLARSAAIFANHSKRPNACIEVWPVLRPEHLGIRQRMMLVASEPIAAGQEVRIDYEDGGRNGKYWNGNEPPETDWRRARVRTPPPSLEEPVVDRLQQLQAAAARGEILPPLPRAVGSGPIADVIPWQGPAGGDARLRVLVPLLLQSGHDRSIWPLVSTHVPGRSGRECKDRWATLSCRTDLCTWVQCDRCEKWRRLEVCEEDLPDEWWCELNEDVNGSALEPLVFDALLCQLTHCMCDAVTGALRVLRRAGGAVERGRV